MSDPQYLGSSGVPEGATRGVRALKVSLVCLLATALLQAAVVVLSGSALLAETLHNFADALTSLPLWVAFRLGQSRPSLPSLLSV